MGNEITKFLDGINGVLFVDYEEPEYEIDLLMNNLDDLIGDLDKIQFFMKKNDIDVSKINAQSRMAIHSKLNDIKWSINRIAYAIENSSILNADDIEYANLLEEVADSYKEFVKVDKYLKFFQPIETYPMELSAKKWQIEKNSFQNNLDGSKLIDRIYKKAVIAQKNYEDNLKVDKEGYILMSYDEQEKLLRDSIILAEKTYKQQELEEIKKENTETHEEKQSIPNFRDGMNLDMDKITDWIVDQAASLEVARKNMDKNKITPNFEDKRCLDFEEDARLINGTLDAVIGEMFEEIENTASEEELIEFYSVMEEFYKIYARTTKGMTNPGDTFEREKKSKIWYLKKQEIIEGKSKEDQIIKIEQNYQDVINEYSAAWEDKETLSYDEMVEALKKAKNTVNHNVQTEIKPKGKSK